MSDKLKKFVTENKQEFETNGPAKDLWKKIDVQMDAKAPSKISSKWLSNLKYIGFSASVLVVVIYFITKNLNEPETKEITENKTEQSSTNSQKLNAIENTPEKVIKPETNNSKEVVKASIIEKEKTTTQNMDTEKDSVLTTETFENTIPEQKNNSATEKKENNVVTSSKKNVLYIPAEPEKINSYSGTLYESSLFCELLHVYKFPGKASLDKFAFTPGSKKKYKKTRVRTISCSHLEKTANLKAVWIRGKTDKEMTLSIGKQFKNVMLIKKDGRKFPPEAISHYYKGLGAINEYTGKSFEIVFKDKVDLILFFKDAQEGDKVSIDGILETIVKDRP